MTDLRKASEMALKALENPGFAKPKGVADAIKTLRQALAQPEQEPVAWGIANTRPTEKNPLMMVMLDEPAPSHLVVPLYAQPVDTVNTSQERVDETAKREHEPVAMINVQEQKLEWAKATYWNTPTIVNMDKIPLYTAPPKREWVGLTDEEQQELHDKWQKRMDGWGSFYQAVEQALKEKNT